MAIKIYNRYIQILFRIGPVCHNNPILFLLNIIVIKHIIKYTNYIEKNARGISLFILHHFVT